MAKIIKRTKRDGTCSYCIRVSNGYDRLGRQVLVNRTYTPPPGLTGKKLEKELQRQADAFEQEVHITNKCFIPATITAAGII